MLTTPHYRLYISTEDARLAARLPGFFEAALAHYRAAVTPLPAPPSLPERLEAFVLGDRADWERLTVQLMGERAGLYRRIGRGGYAWGGRSVIYAQPGTDTFAVAAHEGWHQYTQRVFAHRLPPWLDEGLATYMEGHRWEGERPVFDPRHNPERLAQLRGVAQEGRLLPLGTLLNASPQGILESEGSAGATAPTADALGYYAQAWALARFLMEADNGRHREGLGRLVADAAAGRLRVGGAPWRRGLGPGVGLSVFAGYIGPDLDGAQRDYLEFVRGLIEAGP
ncbi:MAG TPA: hypothetical protein VD963_01920 [Phycisphaerales bacterium]|nr:hypothetical protein [Phycisphaerales bacterium]